MKEESTKNVQNNKKQKCCCTGLHFTKNNVCIQSLRPFHTKKISNKKETEPQSEFCKAIIEARNEPDNLEFEEISKLDIMDIMNEFASSFNIKD